MDRLMVDMAIKLQVRSGAGSGGGSLGTSRVSHRDESKVVDEHESNDNADADRAGTTVIEANIEDELGLNEGTAQELLDEHTEEALMMNPTPCDTIHQSENRSPWSVHN